MNIDQVFIGCLLRDGTSAFVKSKKFIRPYMIEGGAVSSYDFISNYFSEYGEIPSKEFFSAKVSAEFKDSDENIDVVIDEIVDRYLWKKGNAFGAKFSEILDARKPRVALDELVKFQRSISSEIPSEVVEVFDLRDDVRGYYERAKSGELGAKTPWKTLNESIVGLIKREVNIFVSRTGVGKTYLMILLARYAHLHGEKVLFICTEMDRVSIATRFFGIDLGFEPREIRRASLSEDDEKEFFDRMRDYDDKSGFGLLGDDTKPTIENIESAILNYKPDIVFIDGVYLVKTSERGDRHAKVSHVADEMTRISKQRNVCIVGSHQFNRDVDSDDIDTASLDKLGITDVVGWNATNVYALFQTIDMKSDNEMMFIPLKERNGGGRRFIVNWDFEELEFSEINSHEEDDLDDGGHDSNGGHDSVFSGFDDVSFDSDSKAIEGFDDDDVDLDLPF